MRQNMRPGPEGRIEVLGNRIEELRREAEEIRFVQYLDRTQELLAEEKRRVEALSVDVEQNYKIYRERMERAAKPAPDVSGLFAGKRPAGTEEEVPVSLEFKIGAGIFSVVGVLFIVAAFMMFGTSYLQGSAGFLITAGVVFLVNLVLLLIPIRHGRHAANLMQLAGNTVITWVLASVTSAEGIENGLILFYVISSVIVANLLFRRLKKDAVGVTVFVTAVGALGVLYLFLVSREGGSPAAFGILVMVCICFFLLEHGSGWQWIQYWYLCLLIPGYAAVGMGNGQGKFSVPFLAAVLVVFVSAKLLSRVKLLRFSEIVITILAAFAGLWYYTGPYGVYFLAAFLLSALALYRDRMFYQIVITLMGAAYFICHPFLIELTEEIPHYEILVSGTVSILFFCMMLFNLVKPWRTKGIIIYNYCCLCCMALLYLTAFLCTNPVVYTILAVVGILTILLVFRETFGVRGRFRYLILAVFLVYMVFLLRIQIPVHTSVLLMGIAVLSILAGFVLRKKSSRIFGLILSVFVCLKVVFFDFTELPVQERILVFLIVGVIALAIAVIYLLLEKRIAGNEKKKEMAEL